MDPQALDENALQEIQEEIRRRVYERSAAKQGIKTQLTEIEATIEALHEVTQLPMEEIEQIAQQVTRDKEAQRNLQNLQNAAPRPTGPLRPKESAAVPRQLVLDELQVQVDKRRRAFMHHLVSFVVVNTMLITLNAVTGGFPWAMFPLFGWVIGLISHYLNDYHYPQRDLGRRRATLDNEIQAILYENVPQATAQFERLHSGLQRMLLSGAGLQELEYFVRNAVPDVSVEGARVIALQLERLRQNVLPENTVDDWRDRPRRRS